MVLDFSVEQNEIAESVFGDVLVVADNGEILSDELQILGGDVLGEGSVEFVGNMLDELDDEVVQNEM